MRKSKKTQTKTPRTIEISDIEDQENVTEGKKFPNRLKRAFSKLTIHKKITIPFIIIFLVLLLLAIPFSRYKLLGLFIHKDVSVYVYDNQTGRPISEAKVSLNGQQRTTDLEGYAVFESVDLGNSQIAIEKNYYKLSTTDDFVGIRGSIEFKKGLEASGRLVPIKVTNAISGDPVSGVRISADGTAISTDSEGSAVIALDSNKKSVKAELTIDSFNKNNINITVTDDTLPDNVFEITPKGRVYFLSKASGNLDVVGSNLDGSDKKVILPGIGTEDDYSSKLFASRDWKYLILFARRETQKNDLYLIETENGNLTKIDETGDDITPLGWVNHYFTFSTSSTKLQKWQSGNSQLKTYDTKEKITRTLDSSIAEGNSEIDYATESISGAYIFDNKLIYTKVWTADYYSGGRIIGKKHSLNSINPGGTEKQVIGEFESEINGNSFISAKKYNPKILYLKQTNYTQNRYYRYQSDKITENPQISQTFDNGFPVYVVSPGGAKTVWHETRDGKNIVFIGDKNAENTRKIRETDLNIVGWLGEEYLLATKNGSELFITSTKIDRLLKVTDFHSADGQISGDGYSYTLY